MLTETEALLMMAATARTIAAATNPDMAERLEDWAADAETIAGRDDDPPPRDGRVLEFVRAAQ